eukprot:TRINITY_DN7653_c0_g1_i1.p1 TRINITY_DN7653_c0_g1~~TRINITY_DN7653_c0_g1_i1.p1  ORF type:complete len:360 (-),score=73.19 TRINITY_DN7653_c0_g1_i1:17-1096(-)
MPIQVLTGFQDAQTILRVCQEGFDKVQKGTKKEEVPPIPSVSIDPERQKLKEQQEEMRRKIAEARQHKGQGGPGKGEREAEQNQLSLQERQEAMKKKLAQIRQQKEEQSKEDAKQAEIERIRSSKEMQQSLRNHEQVQSQRNADQRKKEKKEEEEAKRRVRDKIEADKLERKRKMQESQEPPKSPAKVTATAVSSESRVAFRLPSGESTTRVFAASDTLQAVRHFISQTYSLAHFDIRCSYPAHLYTALEYHKTLAELDLVPSGSLVIVAKSTVSTNSFLTSNLLYRSLSAIVNVAWSYLTRFLGYRPSPPTPSTSDQQGPSRGSRQPVPGSNIHQLNHDQSKKDDDMNTWNGNSTQQQ